MHHLTLVNYTQDILSVTLNTKPIDGDINIIYPSCRATFTSAKWKCLATLMLGNFPESTKGLHNTTWSAILRLNGRTFFSKYGWEVVKEVPALPCVVYRLEVSRKNHLLIIFPKRSLSSFLADMPSSLPLSSLMLPGKVAFFGWPISQCQVPSTPLAVQFSSGIRVLDVRLSIVNGVLISYHGIYPQRLPFLDIVEAVYTFLTSPEGMNETIIMSIKQEIHASLLFSQLVHSVVYNGPGGRGMWFLENRIPTLGDVRGKVVLFSRFGGDGTGWENGLEGLGIHPTTWPDSRKEGFEWWLKGTNVKTHDWYSIPSFLDLPEKADLASRILLQPQPPPSSPVLSISFLSASSFPLALPPLVARGWGWPSWGMGVEGVNSRVCKWILRQLSGEGGGGETERVQKDKASYSTFDADERTAEARLRGWCMMDYFREPVDVDLVRLLVECNYRGRKAGEEGWPLTYPFP